MRLAALKDALQKPMFLSYIHHFNYSTLSACLDLLKYVVGSASIQPIRLQQCGVVVDARQAGLSISEATNLLELSCTTD